MENSGSPISVTAIVVTYNEDERLDECLKGLRSCDELIVVDLGSSDQTVEIAKGHDACLIHHEQVPVVEQVRANVISEAQHDWVLFIDPDEVLHPSLLERAAEIVRNSEDVGRVFLPWRFYFRGKPLQGTRWGGRRHKGILIHKGRCQLSEDVHRGIELKDEYQSAHIPWEDPAHHIRHYWMDTFAQLFEKHLRYIRREGKSRFNAGWRFSWKGWAVHTLRAFKHCLINDEGWRDGATGVFLSFFNAWYEGMSLLYLRKYQRDVSSPSDTLSA